MAEPGIEPATSCSQVRNAIECRYITFVSSNAPKYRKKAKKQEKGAFLRMVDEHTWSVCETHHLQQEPPLMHWISYNSADVIKLKISLFISWPTQKN